MRDINEMLYLFDVEKTELNKLLALKSVNSRFN
jgi:hypothetical protein